MDKEINKVPDDNPDDVGPGAALDDALERELGIQPGHPALETAHAAPAADVHEAHEPSEHSYWPAVVAATVLVIGIGFLSHLAVTAAGSVMLMIALVGWFREPWVS